MPTDARTLSLIRDVRDLQRRARRHQVNGISGMPIWKYDNFTLTGSGDTTHTLSWIPYGINVLALNGLGLVEGVDYSCDYTTGVVTLTATLTAGDVLAADYVTTGALMVASTPADTGNLFTEDESTFETGLSSNWQTVPGTNPTTISRVSSTSHSGSYSLEIVSTSGDSIPLQARLVRLIPVTAGTNYTLSGWVRTSRTTQPVIRIQGLNGSGGLVDINDATTPGITVGTWGQVTNASFAFSPTVVSARVVLLNISSGSCVAGETMDWDDLWFSVA